MPRTSPAEVRLLGRAFDGFTSAIAAQSDAWPRGTVATEWVELPDLERRVLEGGACSDGSCDLVLVVSDWLPRLVAAGALRPLDDLVAAAPPPGWPDAWSPSMRGLTVVDGVRYGMAYHDGPELLLYRADRYADPAGRAGFQARHGYPLRPPRTWDELADQAAWFTRPDEGQWGTVLAGLPDGHNNVYDFLLQLWSRGGELFDATGAPAFDGPAGLAALRYLDRLWHGADGAGGVVDPAARDWDSVEAGRRFAAGSGAVCVNWAGFAALSADPSSPTYGRVACAPVPCDRPDPGAVSLNVFWALAVTTGARDPEAAWDFARHAATPEMDRQTSLRGGFGTRLSTWRDPEVRGTSPAYAVIEEVHRNVRTLPATPYLPGVVAALNAMVDDMVRRRRPLPGALAAAAARVAALGMV